MRIDKLKAAALFARKNTGHDDPLVTIRVERERIVATSGTAAIAIKDDDGPEVPVHLDPAALKFLRGVGAEMNGTRLTAGVVTVDARPTVDVSRWPDVDKALAEHDTLETPVGVSVDLLEQVVKAAKAMGVKMLRVQIPKDNKGYRLTAIRITPMKDKSFVIHVMPCRIG